MDKRSPGSVSYTHLDVYKRQVLEEYTQKVANGEITPKGFFTDFNSDVAAFEEWRDNG